MLIVVGILCLKWILVALVMQGENKKMVAKTQWEFDLSHFTENKNMGDIYLLKYCVDLSSILYIGDCQDFRSI